MRALGFLCVVCFKGKPQSSFNKPIQLLYIRFKKTNKIASFIKTPLRYTSGESKQSILSVPSSFIIPNRRLFCDCFRIVYNKHLRHLFSSRMFHFSCPSPFLFYEKDELASQKEMCLSVFFHATLFILSLIYSTGGQTYCAQLLVMLHH